MAHIVEEEDVLGISTRDPAVLKATQFILSCVGITAFFLVMELVSVLEDQGFAGLSRFEIIWWIFDTAKSFLLIVTGYLGLKRSSSVLLACFFMLSLLSGLECLAESIYYWYAGDEPGYIVLQVFEAVFFGISMKYARFLWTEARQRSLHEAPPGGTSSKNEYTMLGMQLQDLKVLKATQMVFTSLAVLGSVLGAIVIVGAEIAVSDEHYRTFWSSCLTILLSLALSGYYGVKQSNAGLLLVFVLITGFLLVLFAFFAAVLFLTCTGSGCMTTTTFALGLATVLCIAFKNALFLRRRAAEGERLAELVTVGADDDAIQPTQFGVELETASPDTLKYVSKAPEIGEHGELECEV